jgi:hypothetical protein
MPLTESALAKVDAFPFKAKETGDDSDVSTTDSPFDDTFLRAASEGTEDGKPCWTKARILKLGTELLEGYSAPHFQERLNQLLAKAPNPRQVEGRAELAMTVQSEVLPKYGFEASAAGVEAMTKTFAPFMIDWMVEKLVQDIEKTLGLPASATVDAACGPHKCSGAAAIIIEEEYDASRTIPRPQLRTESLSKPSKSNKVRKEPAPALNKVQVLELLGELVKEFSEPDFQTELQHLLSEVNITHDLEVPGRKDLVRKVHAKVFPKYGLPESSFGAMLMLDAITPFVDEFLVKYLVSDMDAKLGLPKGTTVGMCKGSFRKDERACVEEVHQTAQLTRQQVLALVTELLECFRQPGFQEALKKKVAAGANPAHVQGRAELALTVQRQVLPKYGLEGTPQGVLNMLDQFAPFAGDWMVAQLVSDVDESLGLPRGTTLSIA